MAYKIKKAKAKEQKNSYKVKKEINWDNNGYDIASGKKGTGWMAFTELNAKEVLQEGNWKTYSEALKDEKFEEVLDTYVEEWHETEQWQYEVGSNMTPFSEENIEIYSDERMNWIVGYSAYARKLMEKLAKKEKRQK